MVDSAPGYNSGGSGISDIDISCSDMRENGTFTWAMVSDLV